MDTAQQPYRGTVVMVHGFGAHRLWFWLLGQRLRASGYQTIAWGYRSHWGSLDSHARRLHTKLHQVSTDGQPLYAVGHSMGGVITRLAISLDSPPPVERAVLIAAPNRGTRVARFFGPLLKPVCPGVSQLSDAEDSFVHTIDDVGRTEYGVLAARWDTMVNAANATIDHQADYRCLAATHSGLLFRRDVSELVDRFLTHGTFDPEPSHITQ